MYLLSCSFLNLVLLSTVLLLGSLHCTDSYSYSANSKLQSSSRGFLGRHTALAGRSAASAAFSKRHRVVTPFSSSSIPTTEIRRIVAGRSLIRLEASRSPSSGAGGSTKLDVKIKQKTVTKNVLKEEIDRNYRLVLHDDTVHTIQQVCEIISSTCPLCTGPRAYEVTLEVHMTGAGTVCVANKKLIEEYTKALQAAGLTVSMAPDDDFEPNGGDE